MSRCLQRPMPPAAWRRPLDAECREQRRRRDRCRKPPPRSRHQQSAQRVMNLRCRPHAVAPTGLPPHGRRASVITSGTPPPPPSHTETTFLFEYPSGGSLGGERTGVRHLSATRWAGNLGAGHFYRHSAAPPPDPPHLSLPMLRCTAAASSSSVSSPVIGLFSGHDPCRTQYAGCTFPASTPAEPRLPPTAAESSFWLTLPVSVEEGAVRMEPLPQQVLTSPTGRWAPPSLTSFTSVD